MLRCCTQWRHERLKPPWAGRKKRGEGRTVNAADTRTQDTPPTNAASTVQKADIVFAVVPCKYSIECLANTPAAYPEAWII
jgi:hypothetical protein